MLVLTSLWYFGSSYISLPLALYFHEKYRSERNYAQLDLVHRRALKVLSKLPVRRTRAVAISTSNLGLLRLCQGYYDSAETIFAQAADYVKKDRVLSKTVTAVIVYNNLAIAKTRAKNYFAADEIAHQALAIAESPKIRKRYPIFSCAPHAALAAILMRLNEFEAALAEYTLAMDICENSPVPIGYPTGPFDQFKTHIYLGLAIVTIKLGRRSESVEWYKRFCEMAESDHTLLNTLSLENMSTLANDYMNVELFDMAENLLGHGYAISQAMPFHPDARQLLNYFEKLLLLTERQSEVSDMRSWLRPVHLREIPSLQTGKNLPQNKR